MAEEELLMVVLNRNDSASGFGFSLLGKPGLPPIIYQILEDSPAAESGEVEVGDVILKVNETDVNRFTTKEVLKCLRLSEDPVTLKIKRDPKIKATVQRLCNHSPPPNDFCSPTTADVLDCGLTTTIGAAATHVEMAPVHHQHYRNQQYQQQQHQQLSSGSSSSDSENNCCFSGGAVEEAGKRLRGREEGDSREELVYTKHKYATSTSGSGPSPKTNHHHRSPPTSNGCNNPISSKQRSSGCGHSTSASSPLLGDHNIVANSLINSAGVEVVPALPLGQDRLQWEPLGGAEKSDKPKFEAFMMTGEHILKISNTQQASLLPKQQKKNDSGGRYHNSHAHHLRHTPYPPPPPLNTTTTSPPTPPLSSTNSVPQPQSLPPLHHHRSVPNSPNEHDLGAHHQQRKHHHHNHHHHHHRTNSTGNSTTRQPQCCCCAPCQSQPNSVHTSPVVAKRGTPTSVQLQQCNSGESSGGSVYSGGYFVRTSRSEDQLQQQEQGGIMSAVDIDLEEDVTSSLNTLLDTRQDAVVEVMAGASGAAGSGSGGSSNSSDRIVWTYNAPVSSNAQPPLCHTLSNGSNSTNASSHSNSNGAAGAAPLAPAGSHNGTSSPSSNSLRSTSPASPTSVSSSIMSSHSGGGRGAARMAAQQPNDNGYPTHSAPTINHQHHTHHPPGTNPQQQQQHYHPPPSGNNTNHQLPQQHSSSGGGDYSISEAVSNISSPDYHDADADSMVGCCMEVSDHSDSDSTLLVSEPRQHHRDRGGNGGKENGSNGDGQHRIVIQVKAAGDGNGGVNAHMRRANWSTRRSSAEDGYAVNSRTELSGSGGSLSLRNSRDQMSSDSYEYSYDDADSDETVLRDFGASARAGSSPPISEDESDIDSLHSFHHYSPKAVDLPSAIRLAKRLYCLDGFKKSDVSRHLSKANEFSRAVADEYLRYFSFDQDTLDLALRKFLKQFSLTGETQERERVLVHFSKRFLDCNPGSFNSQDAVHTLTCAIMLLNTDLHGPNMNRKMTCNEFIDNLAGLNENENFPREVLKQLYHAIKNYPLEWALDDDGDENSSQAHGKNIDPLLLSGNPFLDVPCPATSTEHKKGYVMRKCCYEQNAKRSLCCIVLAPFHKRSWKMFYVTLRDLILYLHKDEAGATNAHSSQRSGGGRDHLHNAVRVHHALATPATDYTKKQHVFRLETADQAEYLFQTSDSKELQSWIDTLNFVCASYSAPPLEAAVGSQKKFQRPLLPCSHTKFSLREQLKDHEERVSRLDEELKDHSRNPPERGAKALVIQNYKEKEVYLNFELKRYRCYSNILRTKITQAGDLIAATTAAQSGTGNSMTAAQLSGGGGVVVGLSLVETSIGELDELATGMGMDGGNRVVMGTIGQYIPLGGIPINLNASPTAPPTTYQLLDQPPINSAQLTPPPVPERRSPPSPTALLHRSSGPAAPPTSSSTTNNHHLSQPATSTNRYSYRQAIYATAPSATARHDSVGGGGGGGDIG